MRYQITSTVESDLFVQQSFSLDWEEYRISLNVEDESDKVVSISVSLRLDNYEQYLPKIDESSAPIRFEFKENPHKLEMIRLLQHFESIGGYVLDLRKVHWEYLSEEWLPETEEEQTFLSVSKFEKIQSPQKINPKTINPEYLSHILDCQSEFRDIVIPLAFFREGRNEYDTQRYVNSFYNFYFFIEDLFGSAKTRNKDIMKSFQQSKILRLAVQNTINAYSAHLVPKRKIELQSLLHERSQPFTVDGIIKAIVFIRGNLHHFSQKSSLRKAHPFNQDSFEPEAYLLMSICIMCLVDFVSKRAPALGNLLHTTTIKRTL